MTRSELGSRPGILLVAVTEHLGAAFTFAWSNPAFAR